MMTIFLVVQLEMCGSFPVNIRNFRRRKTFKNIPLKKRHNDFESQTMQNLHWATMYMGNLFIREWTFCQILVKKTQKCPQIVQQWYIQNILPIVFARNNWLPISQENLMSEKILFLKLWVKMLSWLWWRLFSKEIHASTQFLTVKKCKNHYY